MTLTEKQKKHLRRLSHSSKPVVTIAGHGLSDNVLAELDAALDHHELIKVRIRAGDREARDALLTALTERCACTLIRRVGHVATVYRRHPDKPKIILPAAGR